MVDGNDVIAVYRAVSQAVDRARKGEGPSIVECKTYRIRGHYEGDIQLYRIKEEIDEWRKKDPIDRFRKRLMEEKVLSAEADNEITSRVKQEIAEAVEFAKESPYPEPEEALEDLFAKEA